MPGGLQAGRQAGRINAKLYPRSYLQKYQCLHRLLQIGNKMLAVGDTQLKFHPLLVNGHVPYENISKSVWEKPLLEAKGLSCSLCPEVMSGFRCPVHFRHCQICPEYTSPAGILGFVVDISCKLESKWQTVAVLVWINSSSTFNSSNLKLPGFRCYYWPYELCSSLLLFLMNNTVF